MPVSQDLTSAIYAKTESGQQEIQSRSRGLAPLVRRILVMVDGKRSQAELAALLPESTDVADILRELLEQGCVHEATPAKAQPAAVDMPAQSGLAPASGVSADPPKIISGLPPAADRTAKDNDMARHFMINSVNAIIGQNMRISLVHDIFHADTTEKLREVYFAWEASMSNHGMGSRRLPELRGKLFKVL